MAHAHPQTWRDKEQRAQHAAELKGYGDAMKAAYPVEPTPPSLQQLLSQLAATDTDDDCGAATS